MNKWRQVAFKSGCGLFEKRGPEDSGSAYMVSSPEGPQGYSDSWDDAVQRWLELVTPAQSKF